ncbi:MAG: hypothetical protein WD228_05760, partial [Mycobacterium sp.]
MSQPCHNHANPVPATATRITAMIALRGTPLMISAAVVVSTGALLTATLAASPLLEAAPAPVVRTADIELSGFFFGNGTQVNPNAGLLFGSGYSYTASDDSYCTSHVC